MVFPVVMYRCETDLKEGFTQELMLLNVVTEKILKESLGQQGDQTSQS